MSPQVLFILELKFFYLLKYYVKESSINNSPLHSFYEKGADLFPAPIKLEFNQPVYFNH